MRLDDIRQEQERYVRKKLRLQWLWRALVVLIVIAVFFAVNAWGNSRFVVTEYSVQSDRVEEGFRIAYLSDLHNQEYGEGNYDLVEEIRQSRPDLILFGGDMVNQYEDNLDVVLNLCRDLKWIAPVYYTLGNHEGVMMYSRANKIALDREVVQLGIPVLYEGCEDTAVRGNPVTLGVFQCEDGDTGNVDEEELRRFEESDGFRIMISHVPSAFYEKLFDVDAELAVAGHYHGGQIRLPFIGGLYHLSGGFFPRYSGGQYKLGKASLIVGRGLGGHSKIPRINNRPELVLIDVIPLSGDQET